MQKVSLPLALSLMVVSGLVGAGIGYSLTPEYRLSMYDKSTMDLGRPDRWVDLRYVNAMIAHHRAAMLLAQEAGAVSQRQEIRDLSAKILADEPQAIAELYAQKREWYGDVKSVRDPVVARLGSYNETFDLRFLNALIAHHQEGLVMTKDISAKSTRADVLDNANAVENFLTTTLQVFKDWRKEWYNL